MIKLMFGWVLLLYSILKRCWDFLTFYWDVSEHYDGVMDVFAAYYKTLLGAGMLKPPILLELSLIFVGVLLLLDSYIPTLKQRIPVFADGSVQPNNTRQNAASPVNPQGSRLIPSTVKPAQQENEYVSFTAAIQLAVNSAWGRLLTANGESALFMRPLTSTRPSDRRRLAVRRAIVQELMDALQDNEIRLYSKSGQVLQEAQVSNSGFLERSELTRWLEEKEREEIGKELGR